MLRGCGLPPLLPHLPTFFSKRTHRSSRPTRSAGRPNAPYLLPYTARAVAEATASGIDELGAAIRATAYRIFGINLA